MAFGDLTVNEGTQTGIAIDTVGTLHYGIVKLNIGGEGTSTPFTGTLPEVTNLAGGTVTRLAQGSINVTAGTITAGTLTNLVSGTINSATAVLNSGTINVATAVITTLPNLPQGSINVTAGTFVANGGSVTVQGIAGSAAAVSGNPVYAAGQGGNGTLYPLLTDTSGQLKTVMTLGTVATHAISAATITAGTLTNLTSGTINAATAVLNSGTINVATAVITTLPNLPQGSINVTAGTVTAGSIRVTLGTVGGAVASGAAASGNPNIIAGTDSGGTVYSLRTDTNGVLQVNGTVSTGGAGTQDVRLIDGTLTRLAQGSINVTAGTFTGAGGSVSSYGAAASGAAAVGNPNYIAGTDPGGTIYGLRVDTAGVLQVNGTVSTGGAGTQATRLIDGTLTRLEQGSINVTAGTVTAGSIRVTVGTVGGAVASGAAASGNPNIIAGTDSGGTVYSMLVDVAGNPQVDVVTIPNVPGGTLGLVTRVSSLGTLEVGTIATLPNIPGGTIGVVSSITNLAAGTVTRLEQGSIIVTAGTIAAGSIIVTNGTITHGTIDAGTVRNDARTTQNILSYGTTFAATAAAYATLIGSAVVGAGTSTWVQDISITNPAANVTCLVGFGTALNGSSVLLKGTFGTTSAVGIEKSFPKAVNAGMTNQDLVAYVSAAGTIDVNVSYLISA